MISFLNSNFTALLFFIKYVLYFKDCICIILLENPNLISITKKIHETSAVPSLSNLLNKKILKNQKFKVVTLLLAFVQCTSMLFSVQTEEFVMFGCCPDIEPVEQ